MKRIYMVYAAAVAVTAWGCTGQTSKSESEQQDSTVMGTEATGGINQLPEQEKAEGWALLFDGQTTHSWTGYKKDNVHAAWGVEDGTRTLDTSKLASGGGGITI